MKPIQPKRSDTKLIEPCHPCPVLWWRSFKRRMTDILGLGERTLAGFAETDKAKGRGSAGWQLPPRIVMEQTKALSQSRQGESSFSSGPTSKSPNQRERIIELLRRNGKAGLLTGDFLKMCVPRYSSRLCELRQQGYEISVERLTEGCYKYVLLSEPAQPLELPNFQPRSKQPTNEQPPLFPPATGTYGQP